MRENILEEMLDCYDIDDFFKRILESNIKRNPGLVVDYMLDFTMSGSASYIKGNKLKFVLKSFKALNINHSELSFDSSKMSQTIARLNYYTNFLDYDLG